MSENIIKIFSNVAARYDLMNDLLSFGIHRIWKRKLINRANIKAGFSILDCATGSGDLAFMFRSESGNNINVTAVDFSMEMLDIAKSRAKNRELDIDFQNGDILNLKFEDNKFDIVSISFGIRNVDDTIQCLKEMARVTKPGGKVLILEFGKPFNSILWPYLLYAKFIIPLLGLIIVGDKNSYSYLQSSALAYPSGNNFISLMESTECFRECSFEPLSLGIAWLYVGVVK